MASLRPVPGRRDGLVIREQVIRGERRFVCKVVETQDYYYLDPLQHEILQLLDGRRTAGEILEELHRRDPARRVSPETLAECLEGFRGTGLLELPREERRRMLLESLRDRRRARAGRRSRFGNIFEITLPAWNPDPFFARVAPRLGLFWTKGFVIVSLLAFAAMLAIWIARWEEVRNGTVALFTFREFTARDLLQFYLILLITGFLHESAHGATCKHFGGNVTQMGLMILYFGPCFYVDVSDAYLIDSRSRRQWIIFAGGYFETFLCALSTFAWALSAPGTLWNEVAFKFLLTTGLASMVINYNPLIKLDGYYSLMTHLEIPDLSERAFAYASGLLRKTLFRLPVRLETVSRRVRRIFLAYAMASFLYKLGLTLLFLAFLRNALGRLAGPAGGAVFPLLVLLLFRRHLGNLYTGGKFLLLDKREVLMTGKSMAALAVAAAGLVLAAAVPPLPVSVRGEFSLEPRSPATVHAREAGRIVRVLVREGVRVGVGQEVAFLRNEDLTRELRHAGKQLELAEKELAAAVDSGLPAGTARKIRERDHLRGRVRILREREERLTVRSQASGVVTTPRLEDLVGTLVERGGPICEVSRPGDLVARVPVLERRLEEVAPGQRVEMNLKALPFRTLSGRVAAVAPAGRAARSATGWMAGGREVADFDAVVEIADPPDGLRPGMTGLARIRVGRDTLAVRSARALRRWVAARIW